MTVKQYTAQFEQNNNVVHNEVELTKADLGELLTNGFIIMRIHNPEGALIQVNTVKLK